MRSQWFYVTSWHACVMYSAWKPKDNYDMSASVFVVQINGFMSLTSDRKLMFLDYMSTAQDGGNVVSLKHRPPLSPGNTPGTHFC